MISKTHHKPSGCCLGSSKRDKEVRAHSAKLKEIQDREIAAQEVSKKVFEEMKTT